MPLTRLKCDEITEGACFSAPVFFDDGINMFLAANHPAKRYHLSVLTRWSVPFLMTAGRKLDVAEMLANSQKEGFEDVDIAELEAL